MTKKKIIVAGFPKSGCTWATRLIAELIQCPVMGFWQSGHHEIAVEGQNRISDFECYKAHHQYEELRINDSADIKVIYIIRDPRDLAISAMNYFSYRFKNYFLKVCFKIPVIGKLYYQHKKRRLFIKAVIFGNEDIHVWFRINWKDHYTSYLHKENVLFVKYEDLLSKPIKTANDMLFYIGIKKNTAHIEKCIENQSFEKKKENLAKTNDNVRSSHLRTGKSGVWQDVFTKKDKRYFTKNLHSEFYSFI